MAVHACSPSSYKDKKFSDKRQGTRLQEARTFNMSEVRQENGSRSLKHAGQW